MALPQLRWATQDHRSHPRKQVVERLQSEFPLEATDPNYPGESAERWRYADSASEIGVISSLANASCDDCNRVRLSTDGKLFCACMRTRATSCARCTAARQRCSR